MSFFRLVWSLIGIAVLAAIAPARADEPACNRAKAAAFRAAGDRYRIGGKLAFASRWYFEATRYSNECKTAGGLLLNARSLAQAGTTLAQSGDYQHALPVLETAQSRLTSILARDGEIATAAQTYFDLVQRAILAIDGIAQSSM